MIVRVEKSTEIKDPEWGDSFEITLEQLPGEKIVAWSSEHRQSLAIWNERKNQYILIPKEMMSELYTVFQQIFDKASERNES